ncbi:peptidoglycan synthetase [bacterium SCSIO 12741]|nr:peptidoglycan synthetase [bacterium SCSIO 12741]
MRIHFIAIGGSAMHNLALALHELGHHVTGSDDEIFEPSRGRLEKVGLLPQEYGWFPEKISNDLDAIILGMHARPDNPELLKAQELGLSIHSYPEYLYKESLDKTRIVIGGSHGKTSITSMILHVLEEQGMDTDYMVGAQLKGFERMVKITREAPYMLLEGDEYLSSPIDRRPKFHWYKPQVALLSGIAWDHINVFPTFENYVEQFSIFAESVDPDGSLIYYQGDPELKKIAESGKGPKNYIPYDTPSHVIRNNVTYLIHNEQEYPLQVFGEHNLQNLRGAWLVLGQMGLDDETILKSFGTFEGAAKRLEKVLENETSVVFKDFAHSPSKLKATTSAVKKQFEQRELIACMELHTFSSLNQEFLAQYEGAMNTADQAFVYYSPKTLEHKKLPPISPEQVKKAFAREDLQVYTDSKKLVEQLKSLNWQNRNLLLMSSGNFDGIQFDELAGELLG